MAKGKLDVGRQWDALAYFLSGKTKVEIGIAMGISNTAAQHLVQAGSKRLQSYPNWGVQLLAELKNQQTLAAVE